ncbi:MAG: hypothetical protein QOG74_1586, partial [Alphaproteobacteria bacterium]|nr:hypothetical protein [Alphaproteobacteria bacterium]
MRPTGNLRFRIPRDAVIISTIEGVIA